MKVLLLTLDCQLLTALRLQDSRFELANFRIEGRGFEGPDERIACVRGVNDAVHPKPRGGVARIGLVLVGGADRIQEVLFLFLGELLALALELFDLDLNESSRSGIPA